MSKIYCLSVNLNENGLKEKISEYDFKETKNVFVIDKTSPFGGKTTQIKKTEILEVSSMYRENLYHALHNYTWFLDGQIEKAKDNVYHVIRETAIRQARVANKILTHIQQD